MLTTNELVALAPAIAAETPAKHCSKEYVMVNTLDAIAALKSVGFAPVHATQRSAAADRWNTQDHVRHAVTLRIAGTESMTKAQRIAGAVPELRVINSSDGSTGFRMVIGMYRLICSNGLIGFSESDSIVQQHRRLSANDIIQRAKALTAKSGGLFDRVGVWQRQPIAERIARRFAAEALALRIQGSSTLDAWSVDSLLTPQRSEDSVDTLWGVFNCVQEAAMKGLISGTSAQGRALRSRPITDIARDVKFNQQLWALAESYSAKLEPA